jgi:hypothetical protein
MIWSTAHCFDGYRRRTLTRRRRPPKRRKISASSTPKSRARWRRLRNSAPAGCPCYFCASRAQANTWPTSSAIFRARRPGMYCWRKPARRAFTSRTIPNCKASACPNGRTWREQMRTDLPPLFTRSSIANRVVLRVCNGEIHGRLARARISTSVPSVISSVTPIAVQAGYGSAMNSSLTLMNAFR